MANANDKLDIYDNIAVRTLIRLVPFGSAIDFVSMRVIEGIRMKRAKAFFDELSSGNLDLTEDLINSEEFLHCYFCTISAVLKTRRTEKIQYFARLLSAACGEHPDDFLGIDDFEDHLSALDELTFKEISLLQLLHEYELLHPAKSEMRHHRLAANGEFWKEYRAVVSERFGVPPTEFDSVMIRMERSGCSYYPRATANDSRTQIGMTTPLFHRISTHITARPSVPVSVAENEDV